MKGQVNDGGPAFPFYETSVMILTGTQGSYLRSEKDAARIALDYADALLEELDE